jgi:hypothetical protein
MAILIMTAPIGWAAAPIIGATATPNRIVVGDTVRYEIAVTMNSLQVLDTPILKEGELEVVDIETIENQLKSGLTTIQFRQTLQSFKPGDWVVPTQTVYWVTNGARQSKQIPAIPIQIISSLETTQNVEMLPTAKPKHLPRLRWTLIVGSFVGLISCAALWSYLKWKESQAKPYEGTPKRQHSDKSPKELALESIDRLNHHGFIAKGELKAHYSDLTEIIKQFLSRELDHSFMDATTSQTLVEIKPLIDLETNKRLQKLLEFMDTVKFAAWVPESEKHSEALRRAEEIIQRLSERDE